MSLKRIRDWLSTATDRDTEQLPLDADDVFRILGDERRRLTLRVLGSSSEPVPLGILAREVAASEESVAPGDVSSEAYQRVRIALYQSHLLVLDDYGVIDWDEEASVVIAREPVAGLAAIVEEVDNRCR